MPDRVPLVHRHRRAHHFHYDDSTADMEEGAVAAAERQRGGPDLAHLEPAIPVTVTVVAAKQPTPISGGKKEHGSAPPTPSMLTPRARALAAGKSPRAGAGGQAVTAARPPPHLSKSWPWILFGSLVLTFNAGYINTLTLNTLSAMPSAHVTGASCVGATSSVGTDRGSGSRLPTHPINLPDPPTHPPIHPRHAQGWWPTLHHTLA